MRHEKVGMGLVALCDILRREKVGVCDVFPCILYYCMTSFLSYHPFFIPYYSMPKTLEKRVFRESRRGEENIFVLPWHPRRVLDVLCKGFA